MRTASRLSFLVTALACALALACAPSARPTVAPVATPAPAVVRDSVPSVPLLVDNKDYYDFDVYVLTAEGGAIRRVGIAAGLSKTTFLLTGASVASGRQIVFYARSRMSGVEFNSEEMTVYAGLGIRWVLERPGVEWLTSYQLRSNAN